MEQKKKGFSLFKPVDRPDAIEEDTTPTLRYFFKLFGRKFGKILSLNLMMVFQVLPILAAVLIYFFGHSAPTVDAPLFMPIYGAYVANGSPLAALLLSIFGNQLNVPYLTTAGTVAVVLLVGFTVLTWGWQNVGATYNLRSMVRGDSCFLMSDYFYAIRRNLRQGFFFGILDFALIALLAFDFIYFRNYIGSTFTGFLYILIIVLIVLYTFMRFYIYLMMITFDLPIRKILKNALIFSMLGIKRNAMGLLGILLMAGINIAIIVPCLSVGFSVPIILPLFYFLAVAGFMAAYAAYPNIQRYMIDPLPITDDEDEEKNAPATNAETSDFSDGATPVDKSEKPPRS